MPRAKKAPPIVPPLRQMKEEWREGARHKLPPVHHANRAAIRRFLAKMLDRTEKNLAVHRAILQRSPDERVKGLVTYLTHYRATLRDLMAINEARRGYAGDL